LQAWEEIENDEWKMTMENEDGKWRIENDEWKMTNDDSWLLATDY